MRHDGRQPTELRPISFETGYIHHHPGSVLVSFGRTKVLVSAISENRVPQHRLNSGGGWISAEYSLLPASTAERKQRPSHKGADARGTEIQRLIGRSLRQAVDINKIGVKTFHIDCDVIQADGGTRAAAITGGYIALVLLVHHLIQTKQLRKVTANEVLRKPIAAVSLGILNNEILTDLDYIEDSTADTDFTLVASNDGTLVEFQGTAENAPMQKEHPALVLEQGMLAIEQISKLQEEAIQKALKQLPEVQS